MISVEIYIFCGSSSLPLADRTLMNVLQCILASQSGLRRHF